MLKKKVYIYVEKMPEYPGGVESIMSLFSEQYNISNDSNFQASFFFEFIVDDDGKVVNLKIRKRKNNNHITYAEKEALRVLSKMSNWKPGMCKGKPVPVRMQLPIHF